MIKLTTKHFVKNLNLFNTMPVWPYRQLLEDRQEEHFTENYAWNPSSVDVGTRNLA